MTAKSHVATTLNLALIPIVIYPQIIYIDSANAYYLFLGGSILGSLLPDIDESNSYIGRRVSLFSSALNSAVGHRTISHNVFVWIIVILFGIHESVYFIVGVGFGAICHILEDSITNSGVKWAFKPFIKRFALLPKRLRFNTNGVFENVVYIPLVYIILAAQIIYILNVLRII